LKHKDIYLLAFYYLKPKDPKRTKEAGYMTNLDNVDYDESINITRGLKPKDSLGAKVILNLSQQQVTKNGWNDNQDFPGLLAHYQEGYPKYINPLIAQLYPESNNEVNVSSEEEKTGS